MEVNRQNKAAVVAGFQELRYDPAVLPQRLNCDFVLFLTRMKFWRPTGNSRRHAFKQRAIYGELSP
jgi:hypothetical protein